LTSKDDTPPAHDELLRSPQRWAELASIPEALRPKLQRTLDGFDELRLERTPVAQRIDAFQQAAEALYGEGNSCRVPVPKIRDEVSDELLTGVTLRLRSGETFLTMSEQAGWMETPILLYYGLMQTIGAVTRAMFECGDRDLHQHGVKQQRVCDRGAFPRAMVTLSLLTGTPTPLDRLYAPPEGDAVDASGFIEKVWTLHELLNTTPAALAVNYIHQCDLGGQVHTQAVGSLGALGMDLLLLFIASSWARYHPARWLALENTMDGLLLEDAFERCRETVPRWLRLLRGPVGQFGPFGDIYHVASMDLAAEWDRLGVAAPAQPDVSGKEE